MARDHLNRLVARLREGLAAALHGTPWTLGESRTAIQALVIGPNDGHWP